MALEKKELRRTTCPFEILRGIGKPTAAAAATPTLEEEEEEEDNVDDNEEELMKYPNHPAESLITV